jgi:hypothetical protein
VERVVSGETDAAAAVHELATRAVRELVVFENGSLAILQAMSPPDHPNQSMASSRIALNNALVVFFDAYLDGALAGSVSLTAEQRSVIRAGAADMRRYNGVGRESTRELRENTASLAVGLTPAMRDGLDRLFASLVETFATLDRAALLIEEAAAIQDGAKPEELDAVLTSVEALSAELERQNIERATVIGNAQAPAL